MKYTQDVKDKCVEAAKNGMALKAIQLEFGPNPKATLRYLKKAGVEYKDLRTELKADDKLKPATKKQGKSAETSHKKHKAPVEETVLA